MVREEETLIGTAPARLTRREFGGGLVAAVAVLGTGCAAISPSEERKLGEEAAEEVERMVGLVSDPRLVGYVRQVAGRIAAAAKRPDVTWEFNVTDDIEPNAFALPGGYVYVTRGLVALLNSEDELAGVLGHEMAHVLERHAARRRPPAALRGSTPSGCARSSPGGCVSGARSARSPPRSSAPPTI